MDEETLRDLGLSPGATNEQIAAAIKAQRAEAKVKIATAEAKANAEAQARLEAEASTKIAKEQREREVAAAAEAKVLADYTLEVQAFLADATDSLKEDFAAMAFHEEVGPDGSKKRRPNPEGFARAKRMKDANPAASKAALAGPSKQVAAARAAEGTSPDGSVQSQQVLYPTRPGLPAIEISRITGATKASIAKRQQELVAKYGTDVLNPEGFAVNG